MQPQNIFNAKYMQWIKYIYRPTRQIFKVKIYARHKIYAKHKLVCSTQNIYAKEKIHPVTKYMQCTKIYTQSKIIFKAHNICNTQNICNAMHKIYMQGKIYIHCQNICKTQYIKDIWLRLKQNMCTSRAIYASDFFYSVRKFYSARKNMFSILVSSQGVYNTSGIFFFCDANAAHRSIRHFHDMCSVARRVQIISVHRACMHVHCGLYMTVWKWVAWWLVLTSRSIAFFFLH